MEVTLTIEQRLNLMAMLRIQGRGTLKGDGRILAKNIFGIIKIPKEDLKKYEVSRPNGPWRDQDAVDNGPSAAFELEDERAGKLLRLIQEFPNWGPDDDEWLDPVLAQLEPAK